MPLDHRAETLAGSTLNPVCWSNDKPSPILRNQPSLQVNLIDSMQPMSKSKGKRQTKLGFLKFANFAIAEVSSSSNSPLNEFLISPFNTFPRSPLNVNVFLSSPLDVTKLDLG